MENNKRKKISKLLVVVVLLVGLICILLPCIPQKPLNEDPMKTILLSVGCSLLATGISTYVLKQDGTQDDILDTLTEIKSSVNDLLHPEYASNILKEIGINTEYYKRHIKALSFPNSIKPSETESIVKNNLEKFKIEERHAIGHLQPTTVEYFYDLIGGTCDTNTARIFALYLSSFWASNSPFKDIIAYVDFDFVLALKSGSPILGYEFAKLIGKPFLLHEVTARFKDNQDDMRTWFNCSEVPEKGTTALIVDDSITGGAMVSEAIDHLRQYGYIVHTCFVVFEPQIKNARERLKNKGVQLVSIIKTHT